MNGHQKLLILLSVFVILGLENCRKNGSDSNSPEQTLIENARQYFEAQVSTGAPAAHTGNPRLDVGKTPSWSAAYSINLSRGPAVVVPVFYQQDLVVSSSFNPGQVLALNQLTKLVIWRDSAGYNMELVTAFPDSAGGVNRGVFSGILFVETWQGKRLETYKFSGGRVWRKDSVSVGSAGRSGSVTADAVQAELLAVQVCYEVNGYNYSVDDPDNGESWTESAGCSTTYVADDGDGQAGDGSSVAGGSGGGGSGTATVVNYTGNNIIGNIKNYLQCFSNYGGSDHTYQVTICVSQPVPGTRTPWTSGSDPSSSSSVANPVNVGHTYLVFAEIFSDHSVVRNVGFYPATDVYPWAPSAQGQLNNDAGHDYNISLTITVDNGQFFNMLNYVAQGNDPGYLYNLSTNNCTSFCLHTLDQGGVTLQTEVGSWPGGGFGYDPGDLGEDIRNMPLSSNMSRSTTYVSRPNLYTCD
jgi:hypothetical protein